MCGGGGGCMQCENISITFIASIKSILMVVDLLLLRFYPEGT